MKASKFFAIVVIVLTALTVVISFTLGSVHSSESQKNVLTPRERLLERLQSPDEGKIFVQQAQEVLSAYQIARASGFSPKEDFFIYGLVQDHVEEILRALLGKVDFPGAISHEWYVEFLGFYHRDGFDILFSEEELATILFQKKIGRAKELSAKIEKMNFSPERELVRRELESMIRTDPVLKAELVR